MLDIHTSHSVHVCLGMTLMWTSAMPLLKKKRCDSCLSCPYFIIKDNDCKANAWHDSANPVDMSTYMYIYTVDSLCRVYQIVNCRCYFFV